MAKGYAANCEEIVDAILEDRPLIYSERVLGHGKGMRLPAPPTVKSYREEYPEELSPNDAANPGCLTLFEFEALSLAARARLLNLTEAPSAPNAPPHWATHFKKMRRIDGAVLSQAIIRAAKKAGRDKSLNGIHVIGAAIEGDIDLTNAHLPFSVRIIGCAVEGALRISRANLGTLDLSGSALRGIHGTFLNARGSVRMRRMTSTSVIDFGGLKVADIFDASDLLVFPFDDAPASEAVVGDRGIVNLSLASLSNEMRMFRARIYGGLTMKGCRIERSMFIDDAILRAPIAYLERVGADVSTRLGLFDDLPLAVRTAARAERKLAKELHGNPDDENPVVTPAVRAERRLRCEFEALQYLDLSNALRSGQNTKLIQRLLAESSRARTSCLRADGLMINGSVFARSIRSSGRIRCKYAKISGSFHLSGARMRSTLDIQQGIKAVSRRLKGAEQSDAEAQKLEFRSALQQLLKLTRAHAAKLEPIANDDYALDIRESHIHGHLHLTPDNRKGEKHEFDKELRKRVDCYLKDLDPKLTARWRGSKGHVHSVYVNGQISMEGARIDGDFELNGILANLHNAKRRPRPRMNRPGEAFLLMEQAKIGGEVDLCDSIGIHGIEAQHVNISSRIRFARHSVRRKTLMRRALLMGGRFLFADARIGGDATFLFDKERGPWLMLARTQVEGRLHILPAEADGVEGAKDSDWHDFERRKLSGKAAREAEREQAAEVKWARQRDETANGDDDRYEEWKVEDARNAAHAACFKEEIKAPPPDEQRKHYPAIDLRSARAAEFGHPEAAWPREDHLQVEGFVYNQSAYYGPLAPRAREPRDDDDFSQLLFWSVLSFVVVAVLLTLFYWLPALAPQISYQFGLANVLVLVVIVGVFLAQLAISRLNRPTRADGLPRAIYWLGLQKAALSVYQRRGQTIPLQPYVQAGLVLRSTGQILAANHVEVDRLRRRHQQLSWRNNWYTRVLLVIADGITRYGFDPIRTIGIAIGIAALAACVFHMADRDWHMRPIDGDLLQVVAARSGSPEGTRGAAQTLSAEELVFASEAPERAWQGGPASRVTNYPAFSALPYALDVMAPGLDLGQEEYWRPMATHSSARPRSDVAEPAPDAAASAPREDQEEPWWWLFAISAPLLKILGWLLTTAIAVSLITRVEAMIARHEE